MHCLSPGIILAVQNPAAVAVAVAVLPFCLKCYSLCFHTAPQVHHTIVFTISGPFYGRREVVLQVLVFERVMADLLFVGSGCLGLGRLRCPQREMQFSVNLLIV